MSERTVFLEAVRLADPGERAAYLDRACAGDPELRARLDDLLAAHAGPDSLLDQPAGAEHPAAGLLRAHETSTASFGPPGTTADLAPEPPTRDPGATADHAPESSTATPGAARPRKSDPAHLPTVPGYEVVGVLGEGGMGVVYKAVQTAVGRTVALKTIRGQFGSHGQRARFRAEAEAAARLTHPGVVRVYEVGEAAGVPYFTLEFCDGGSLQQKLDGTPWHPLAAARLAEMLADAVAAAHRHGVVHRDLKPANVLLARQDAPGERTRAPDLLSVALREPHGAVPKIADFGISKRLDSPDGPTATGAVMGTPSYMAPEQAGGDSKGVGPPADVYAIGAILYELLTGRPPFKAATVVETLDQVRNLEPVGVRAINPGCPRDLETICARCLQKDPAKRYAGAAELADDLRRFQDGRPILARPVGRAERVWRWARRRPTAAGLWLAIPVALLASVVAVTAAIFIARLQAEKDRAEEARKDAERFRYFQHIALAGTAWQAHSMERVEQLLDGCPDEYKHNWEWRYLKQQCHRDLLTIDAHPGDDAHPAGGIWGLAVSPDGRRLVTGSLDRTVKVWDAITGRLITTLTGHGAEVLGVAFSPDGKWIASASWDTTVRIWDATTLVEVHILRGHEREVAGVAFNHDGTRLASASWDGTVRIWNPVSGKSAGITGVLKGHASNVVSVEFSPDGTRLATASWDETARIWDLASEKEIDRLEGHKGEVHRVAYSQDGNWLATAGADHTVRIWDIRTGKKAELVRTFSGHTSDVWGVAFSPDGKRVASGGGDQTVKIWDPDTGEEYLSLHGHGLPIRRVVFSPDGFRLYTSSHDRTVKVWASTIGSEAHTFRGHTKSVTGVAFSRDGKWVASASRDGTVKVWDRQTGRVVHDLKGHTREVLCVAFSPAGRFLASGGGGGDNTVIIWDMATGHPVHQLRGHEAAVASVAYNHDGSRLASGSHDKTIRIWDPLTGQFLKELEGHGHRVRSVAFNATSTLLASGSGDQTARVWDTATFKEVNKLEGALCWVHSVAFSPTGPQVAVGLGAPPPGEPVNPRLVVGSGDGSVQIWDPTSGTRKHAIHGHANFVYGVAFHPDGDRVASGSVEKTVKVWSVEPGEEVLTLTGHTGAVNGLAFSPVDGHWLATAGADGTVRLWDGRPVSPDQAFEREALGLLEFISTRTSDPTVVRERLRTWEIVRPEARQLALAWLEQDRK